MPTELHVLMHKDRLPDLACWQSAIDALGLGVALDPATRLPQSQGDLWAAIASRRARFTLHVRPGDEVKRVYTGLQGMFPERDLAVTFRYEPAPVEAACALSAMAGLVQCADGVWFDPADGVSWDLDAAVRRAKGATAAAGR